LLKVALRLDDAFNRRDHGGTMAKGNAWRGPRAADSSGDRRRAKGVVRAETDTGRVTLAADVRTRGGDEGMMCIYVESLSGL
jgi:hypothetical protein